jgi:hypothetical protein
MYILSLLRIVVKDQYKNNNAIGKHSVYFCDAAVYGGLDPGGL